MHERERGCGCGKNHFKCRDRELIVEMEGLRHIPHKVAALPRGFSVDPDGSKRGGEKSEKKLEEGRFTCAIGADDAIDSRLMERCIRIFEDPLLIVAEAEVDDVYVSCHVGWRR